jgi:predicted  nucleic acid-binding Zn-ribbon protein
MHKCLKCGKKFEKMTEEMLRGCPECGGNLFLYVKNGEVLKAKDIVERVQVEERVELEPEEAPVESLRIMSPGVYELNLDALLEKKEVVMRIKDDGTYAIHLPSLFKKKRG